MKKLFSLLALFTGFASFTQYNNCLKLDGVNDYVNLDVLQADFYSNSSAFTIEFWMKAGYQNQTSSVRTTMFAINQPAGENRLLLVLGGPTTQDGLLLVYDEVPLSGPLYISTDTIGDNQCHHIAYVYDGSLGHLYIDGQLMDTHTPTLTFTPTDRFSIGQEWDNSSTSQFYNGTIDDLRIWNIVRSANDIQQNMSKELWGSEPNLIAYYDFNQGAQDSLNTGVDTLIDKTGNGNTGDLYNFELNYSVSNWIRSVCTVPALDFDDNQLDYNFTIYPNPANNVICLSFDEALRSDVEIRLYDLSGKQVSNTTTVSSLNMSSVISIPVDGLSTGTYLLRVSTMDGLLVRKVQIAQ